MNLFFKKKNRPDFFNLLSEQSSLTLESMALLMEYMKNKSYAVTDDIELHEKRADRIRAELIDQVHVAFITPMDRHDLFSVSRRIDDVTDKIKDLKDFLVFFQICPTENNLKMAEYILDSISCIDIAVKQLHETNDAVFWENIVKAKKNENQVKRYYWDNINELNDQRLEINDIIIFREFAKDLNSLANKIGRTADKLSDMKIKSIE